MVAGIARKIVGRFRGWMQTQLISDVPGDIAACEFECKRPECSDEKFVGCERRKRAEARVELERVSEAARPSAAPTSMPANATTRPSTSSA